MVMQEHRLQPCIGDPLILDFSKDGGFSSFDYLRTRLCPYSPSIHRCFSIARSMNCKTLVEERIKAIGLLAIENEDISAIGGWTGEEIFRLSFWSSTFVRGDEVAGQSAANLIGYAIIKNDGKTGQVDAKWYVFEAVFIKYGHENNCVPWTSRYAVTVADTTFDICGVLYCQQNGCNKACAQVALRSLLSRVLHERDVAYRVINEIAGITPGGTPGDGLTLSQIIRVLDSFKLAYSGMVYKREIPLEERIKRPYQDYLYDGVESGIGSLLVFNLGNRYHRDERAHVVPIFGHTFNKDTWVTDADVGYFKIDSKVEYLNSSNWTSSFICHDDNFGPNFCMPRYYVEPEQVLAAINVKQVGFFLDVKVAESVALHVLGNILPLMNKSIRWKRVVLRCNKESGKWEVTRNLVLRSVFMSAQEYINYVKGYRDWRGNVENTSIVSFLSTLDVPNYVLVVEYSLLQLFPANKRKLGEVVFDASCQKNNFSNVESAMLIARMPGNYAISQRCLQVRTGNLTDVVLCPSALGDHVELIV